MPPPPSTLDPEGHYARLGVPLSAAPETITAAYRRDETQAVQWLLAQGARPSADAKPLAHRLVSSVRARISFVFVAMTRRSMGRPICLAA